MKRMRFFMIGAALLFSGAVLLSSCDNEPVIPTLNFIAEADGYDVNITVEATDAIAYTWNYGDGNNSTAAGNHTYTYKQSGTYTIVGKVSSEDGETASKSVEVTIAASLEEILSGGPSMPNGKVWVLNKKGTPGKDGGGIVDNAVPIHPSFSLVPDNVLDLFGLGSEYTDEFTFKHDGTYKIDLKNGRALAGIVYGYVIDPTGVIPSSSPGNLPLAAANYTVPANGTWSIDKTNYTIKAYNEFKNPPVLEDVTFTFSANDANKKGRLKLSDGQYCAVFDRFANTKPVLVILKEVTQQKVHLAIGMTGVQEHPDKPTLMLHLTLVPK